MNPIPREGASLRMLQCAAITEGLNPIEVTEATNWCMKAALIHSGEYRAARGRLMNENPFTEQSPIIDPIEQAIYDHLREYRSRFGNETLVYQTLLRATSYVSADINTIHKDYIKNTNPPPAFDPNMPSEYDSVPNRKMRRDIIQWIKNGHEGFPQELKDLFRDMMKWLDNKEPEYIVLTNGTTTSLVYFGINLTDIMGTCMCPTSFMNRFPNIGKFFKVRNRFCDDDGVHYVTYPEGPTVTNIGGVHKVIPDKDGKVREIYQMYPWVQILSKAVHVAMDRVARKLPGNYTYDQRRLLLNIVERGYNKIGSDFTLVGTDMSKYSDTLIREFIMNLLRACGIPNEVVEELDDLYSLPIYDELKKCIWKDSVATYQGQYGDFPLITISNIVLQEYMYYWTKIPHIEGVNGAVGDDTCTGAPGRHLQMIEWIEKIYGSVGVRINPDKTSVLYDGRGAIDFVKLQVNCTGILGFLNIRAAKTCNWDKIVLDVMDSHLCYDDKVRLLTNLFPNTNIPALLNISKLNGGISDHPINELDLAGYCYKMLEIQRIMKPKRDDVYRFLQRLIQYLEEDLVELVDTPMVGFLTKEDITLLSQHPELDVNDYLVKRILNIVSLGYKGNEIANLNSLIGKIPSELDLELEEEEYSLRKDGLEWNRTDYLLTWKQVQDHESWMAFRDKSSLRRLYSGDRLFKLSQLDLSEQPIFNDFKFSNVGLNTIDLREYDQLDKALRSVRNHERVTQLLSKFGKVYTISCFGNTYYYIKIDWYGLKGNFRLYGVSYNSYYSMIPEQFYNTRMADYLRISYRDFYKHWTDWQDNSAEYLSLLGRCKFN